MNFIQNIYLFQRIDKLLRLKATGTPKQLAGKLDLCERQVKNIIHELREEGLPIVYDKCKKTYHYAGEVITKFEVLVIDDTGKKNILGGIQNNFNFYKDFYFGAILLP